MFQVLARREDEHQEKFEMSKKIYVGNLPYSATEDEIRGLFASYGQVDSVSLVTDRETGRPRGFGFVEMSSGAAEAIQALDQSAMGGRTLNVNEARPREPRGGGGGDFRGGGGGGGGRRPQRNSW
jgi:RNA recognition motif-containing protein